jgi:hypothetical protein
MPDLPGFGSGGRVASEGRAKSKAEVKSSVVCRRHADRFRTGTPKRRSRKRSWEVWSKTSEATRPPRLKGDTRDFVAPPGEHRVRLTIDGLWGSREVTFQVREGELS